MTTITANINFTCTWEHADVQKLFDELLIAGGISELGLSMIFDQDEPTQTEKHTKIKPHQSEPKHLSTDVFKEDPPISKADLGRIRKTSDQGITYRVGTVRGGIVIQGGASKISTTMEAIEALPDKIPPETIAHLNTSKRAIVRKFRKWVSEMELPVSSLLSTELRSSPIQADGPDEPILTGGAKVDTRASGKVEGFLE